ncbi:MAG: HlyD family secretion protein [Planctomycetes bacterium]|nr:HlyD family secretion protein [Planctomycetota bacterium]
MTITMDVAHPRISAASNELPAMRLVQSSRLVHRLAKLLLVGLLIAVLAVLLLPWQQSARGTGEVVAFVPQEREQTVLSPVKGVVARIADGLVEGAKVKRGEFIVEIEPYAANLVDQLRGQLQDLRSKLGTAEVKAEVYAQNIIDFTAVQDYAVKAAKELVQAAEAKLDAKQESVAGYESKEWQARVNYERQLGLFEKGIKSEKEIEYLKKDWEVAKAELAEAEAEVEAAMNEKEAKENELEQKRRDAQTKIDYARAMREDAIGQAATVRKEMRDVEIKLGELERLTITAPRDGVIFRLPVYERGQTLKEGDALFTIVPDSSERAVELWISGNDTPLIQLNDEVRLQFEGWPAVQFAGWPSVAVGTFGGKVVSIDPADNAMGKFRILVKPQREDDWPSARYLRQGVRTNGWVMLNRVALGYEIWRQLNGFPPVIAKEEPDAGGKESKAKVKLPK